MTGSPRQERPQLVVANQVSAGGRWRFVDDVQVLDLPKPTWLVRDMIEAHSSVEVFGQPESFKSFVALDLALCVGTGKPFCGRPTVRGDVVYVCGEGLGGLPPRVDAWKHAREEYRRAGVFFLTGVVNLLDPADVAGFIKAASALSESLALIVFDTLARCIPGGDENRQQDMGLAVASLDLIREKLPGEPANLVLHHTPRGSDTSRGSNSLDGAMETQILLKREGDAVTLSCVKQKNAEHFADIALRRELVQESIVLVTPMERPNESRLISGDPRHRALASLHRSAPLDEGLTTNTWCKVTGLPESSFYAARTFLVANGYAEGGGRKRGAKNRLTIFGLETITANSNVTPRSL